MLQAVHGWSSTYERLVKSQKFFSSYLTQEDLSRLGRDYIMTGHYMERYFPEKRVRYISLLDGIDTGVESTANDITPFRAIMNDMYAKDISKKIKSVKRDKQRKGQFIGGKPMYGYKMHPTEKNEIVIDEEVAPVVRRIFAMALDGMSCRNIATTLNEEGVPTPATYCGWNMGRKGPYAGLWSSERISEMLQNETYLGNMVQGRTVKISYKSKKCLKQDRENWVVVENTHEPLIDKETFQKVRMLVNSRKHTRSRTYDFLLKGLIFCHECGYPMAVLNRPPVSGEDRLFFVCRTYQRFTKAGVCSCHSIKEQTVTEAVLAKVREVCEAYPKSEEIMSHLFEEYKIGSVTLKNRVAMAPMGHVHAADGGVSEQQHAYILERAKGGFGLIYPSAHTVTDKYEKPEGSGNFLFNYSQAARLAHLVDEVHQYGAKFAIQLTPGYGRVNKGNPAQTIHVSASDNRAFYYPDVVHLFATYLC